MHGFPLVEEKKMPRGEERTIWKGWKGRSEKGGGRKTKTSMSEHCSKIGRGA